MISPDLDGLLEFLETHPAETLVEYTASHYGIPSAQLFYRRFAVAAEETA